LAEDTVNLVAYAGTVPAGVKRILVKRLEVVVLGRLLELLGPNPDLSSAEPEDRTALRAGWTIHRSAAEYMPQTSAEQALYRDAAVLRSYAEQGRSASVAQVENLLEALDRRLFIFVHTFEPDEEDVWGWLDRVADWHEQAAIRRKRFGQAYAAPEPGALRNHLTEPNFLSHSDALVRFARAAGKGEQPSRTELAAALESARGQSLYARTLAHAFTKLQNTSW
jgi:hypothetical protein